MTFLVNEQNVSVMYMDMNAISLYLDLNLFQQDEYFCSKLGIEVEYANSNLTTSLFSDLGDLSIDHHYFATLFDVWFDIRIGRRLMISFLETMTGLHTQHDSRSHDSTTGIVTHALRHQILQSVARLTRGSTREDLSCRIFTTGRGPRSLTILLKSRVRMRQWWVSAICSCVVSARTTARERLVRPLSRVLCPISDIYELNRVTTCSNDYVAITMELETP